MKYLGLVAGLLPVAMAAPAITDKVASRATLQQITDSYLFSISLPEFTTHRNALDPNTLDWSSDGCTDSPDNPFGFPFVPACNRHDFGYQNYRLQSRFTKAAKASIDSNFKKDLDYQCEVSDSGDACTALADVYYAAVKAFGGGDATKRDEHADLVAEYYKKVDIYNQKVKEAQAKGELPILPGQ